MMSIVYIFRDHVTDDAADEYVRWKMLPRAISRIIDQSGQAVSQYFCQGSWILVRYNARDGPRGRSVFGRERTPSIKEGPTAIPLIGTFAPQRVLHRLDNHE